MKNSKHGQCTEVGIGGLVMLSVAKIIIGNRGLMEWVWSIGGMTLTRENQNSWNKNLSLWSHMDWPGTEPASPCWEDCDYLPQLWHGSSLFFMNNGLLMPASWTLLFLMAWYQILELLYHVSGGFHQAEGKTDVGSHLPFINTPTSQQCRSNFGSSCSIIK